MLTACTGVSSTNGLVATDSSSETIVEKTDKVEIVNKEVPEWALWAMGGGIFCFALIIPSPFKFKGFR